MTREELFNSMLDLSEDKKEKLLIHAFGIFEGLEGKSLQDSDFAIERFFNYVVEAVEENEE